MPEDQELVRINDPEVSSYTRDGKWNMVGRFLVTNEAADVLTIEVTKTLPIEDIDQHPPFPMKEMRKTIEDFFAKIRSAA